MEQLPGPREFGAAKRHRGEPEGFMLTGWRWWQLGIGGGGVLGSAAIMLGLYFRLIGY